MPLELALFALGAATYRAPMPTADIGSCGKTGAQCTCPRKDGKLYCIAMQGDCPEE